MTSLKYKLFHKLNDYFLIIFVHRYIYNIYLCDYDMII
jgi:hypothetical protein